MNKRTIRVLVADDDRHVLDCYREGLSPPDKIDTAGLQRLAAELFGGDEAASTEPVFELVTCCQGQDAVDIARAAITAGQPFDVIVLDIRMPPGIDGVEAGAAIRRLDRTVSIIFVSGYSDYTRERLAELLPPPDRMHCMPKPVRVSRLEATIRAISSGPPAV